MIADDRRARFIASMADAKLDAIVVYGNAWQGDYLRYATDFGILEGQALAIVGRDGHIALYLDSPLEVDRAELNCPSLEVIYAPDLMAAVDAPACLLPNGNVLCVVGPIVLAGQDAGFAFPSEFFEFDHAE